MSRLNRVGLYKTRRSSSRARASVSSNQVFRVVEVISAPMRAFTFSQTSAAGFMAILLFIHSKRPPPPGAGKAAAEHEIT